MNWIVYNDCYNLDKMKHIWMEKNITTKEFFLMGKFDSGEEVIISRNFESELECLNHLYGLIS